jgi:hypothetical protein
LFLIYTLIGYFGLGLSIASWPVNFFRADQLLHWILPAVVVLSVGFAVAGGVIYSLGKGYGWGPGCVALLGPLGVAILIAMPNRAAARGEQPGTTTPLGNGAASPTDAPKQSESAYAKTIRQGLFLALGLFLGNWIGVPMIQKGKTFGDGFLIGCIAFLLVMVIYAIIAMVQSRNAESNRLGKSQNRE